MGTIDELMGDPIAGLEPHAVAGLERVFRFIKNQSRGAFQDLHELVLFRMVMEECGDGPGRKLGQIDTEIREAEMVA